MAKRREITDIPVGRKGMRRKASRVAILATHIGENLVLAYDPSEETVKDFVRGQNERYRNGEPGGPSGMPAYHIISAAYYKSLEAADDPDEYPEAYIDISGL